MTRLHLLHTCTATLPSFPGTVTSPEAEEEEEEEEEEDATVGAALPGANGGVPSMENRAFHRARSTVVRMDETFSRKTNRTSVQKQHPIPSDLCAFGFVALPTTTSAYSTPVHPDIAHNT